MDGVTLLQNARTAGLSIEVKGDLLRIRGPKRAASVARELLKNKSAVLKVIGRKETSACWSAESNELIDWFIDEGQYLIPDSSFRLCPWIEVTNPARFREYLLFSISLGPEFITNKNGKLREDLRMLNRKLVSGSNREIQE